MDGNGCRASALSDVANHESAALEESHDFEYICVLGAAPSKDRFDKLRRLHTKHARGSSFHLYDVPVGIHAIGVGVARSRVDRNSVEYREQGSASGSENTTRTVNQKVPSSRPLWRATNSGRTVSPRCASFLVKTVLLMLAGVNALAFDRGVYPSVAAWDTSEVLPARAKFAGAASLALWFGVIFCGNRLAM